MLGESQMANYEKTQGTKFRISKNHTPVINTGNADFVEFSTTVKDISIKPGQKNDIEVTSLASTEQEFTNGLPAAGEVSFNVNWSGGEAGQQLLQEANDKDLTHEFQVILQSGYGWKFIAEVRSAEVSIGLNGVVAGSYTLRIKGKVQTITPGKKG